MNKNILLTEEQIKIILKEELGIAKEVNRISRLIETEICKLISKNISEYQFKIEGININFRYFYFKNKKELEEWYFQGEEDIKDGYSYKDKILYINVFSINGNFDINYLFDTIQHEIEHYWQTKNSGKSFLKKSELLTDLLNCGNPVAETIARVVYFSKKFELDAYINGSYRVLEKEGFSSFNDYINGTNISQVISILNECKKGINNWNFELPYVIQGINMCLKNKIITYPSKNKLLILIDKSYNYIIKKASKAWCLYKTKNTTILSKKEISEKIINDKILGKFLL